MKFSLGLAAATVSAILAISGVSAQSSSGDLPPIEIVGNKFFYSNNGSQFFIRGIAYQSDVDNSTSTTFNDPLADADACKRDLPYLLQLNTNTLRVYAINTSLDHTACINLFAQNGIYIIADLSEPGLSINRDSPRWDVELYQRYTSVVDVLANYTNVLGFFAGNEVTNNNTNTDASAFVKAAVRDTKKYISDKNYRKIPVGYSANDDQFTRQDIAEYFVCGDSADAADFYGINMYEWCGDSSFQTSGYADRTKEFSVLGVPAFFSEYGCIRVIPRKFTEVGTIYSSEMTDVWSGGIVYMYFEEANNYGLVTVDGSSISTMPGFGNLSKQMASISPTAANTNSVSSATRPACPASTGSNWKANTNLPPSPNQGVCDCVSNAATCVVDDSVSAEDYGKLFGYLCGVVSCAGISGNGTTGAYGAYSFCSAKDQLNFVLDLYYQSQNKNSGACDFSGSASIKKSPSTASSCSAVLKQAGSAGTGLVTASVTGSITATNNPDKPNTTGGSGSGAAASTTKKKNGGSSTRGSQNTLMTVLSILMTLSFGSLVL